MFTMKTMGHFKNMGQFILLNFCNLSCIYNDHWYDGKMFAYDNNALLNELCSGIYIIHIAFPWYENFHCLDKNHTKLTTSIINWEIFTKGDETHLSL